MEQRLWLKVTKDDDGCWRWHGAQATFYGVISDLGKNYYVHRLAWTIEHGPIPPGMTIDHLCRTRLCVNVAHMELVTRAENARRSGPIRAARKTCHRGHVYEPGSYKIENGSRRCIVCRKLAYAIRKGAPVW